MQSGISVFTNFQVHHDPFEISGIADTIPLHFAADNFVSKSSFGSNRKIAVYNKKIRQKTLMAFSRLMFMFLIHFLFRTTLSFELYQSENV